MAQSVAEVWMRLILTTVYHAYHSVNLSQTAAFLASDKCKSFMDFQRIRARQSIANRYSAWSCIDLFHKADSLFDPCCAVAQEAVRVGAHTNRTLPPSRRRVAVASSGHAGISEATNFDENAASWDS